jgi:hypothetical protein
MTTQLNHKLPTLAELHKDNEDAFANDQLKTLLNMPPNQAWIKKHPLTGQPYLPVDKVDYLLDRIFGRWEIVVKQIFQIENSVCAIVTLKVWDPVTLTWACNDGGGAMPIQVDSGSKPADMISIKSNAIQLAVPAAISYAKKDAAENFGKIFGRDITRKDTIGFDPTFKEDPFQNDGAENQTPPPPPPLPEKVAAKVTNKTAEVMKDATTPTPPAFTADAFAAPVPAAVQFPDIDTKIDF